MRRAGFIHLNMRIPVTVDGAPGRREAGKRDRIRRGAAGHREYSHVALEESGKRRIQPTRPWVFAVWRSEAIISPAEGCEDFRRHASGIIGAKIHAR